jgi:hypothetical protein
LPCQPLGPGTTDTARSNDPGQAFFTPKFDRGMSGFAALIPRTGRTIF